MHNAGPMMVLAKARPRTDLILNAPVPSSGLAINEHLTEPASA